MRTRIQTGPNTHIYVSAPALPPPRQKLPCVHLGADTGEKTDCPSCTGRVQLNVFSCVIHGRCTPQKPAPGTACCTGCPDHTPDRESLIAPRATRSLDRPWEGRLSRKPWQHRITAVIPHLDTPETLKLAVELLRLQTEPPYLLVIDTGSAPEVREQVEALRDVDLEVHHIRAHGYVHSSEPVAVAQDLAMALCRSEYLFCTHADVFLRRRDFLAWLLARCSEKCPVVGYEMSPRSASPLWQGTPSHTATMLHMPTMLRIGATWSLQRWYAVHGVPAQPTVGWPDTESMFGECLRQAGITPLFITTETCPGARKETNFERHVDINLDHARSLPGLRVYQQGSSLHRQAEDYARQAVAEAQDRVMVWRNERIWK